MITSFVAEEFKPPTPPAADEAAELLRGGLQSPEECTKPTASTSSSVAQLGSPVLPKIFMYLDQDRDGRIDEEPVQADQRWSWGSTGHGATLVVNNDCDNDEGRDDCLARTIGRSERSDLTLVQFCKMPSDPFPLGCTITISIDRPEARVFNGSAPGMRELLGPNTSLTITWPLDHCPPAWELAMEATQFPGPTFNGLVTLSMEVKQGGGPICSAKTQLRVAPWLMAHHLDLVTDVFIVPRKQRKLPPPPVGPTFVPMLASSAPPPTTFAPPLPSFVPPTSFATPLMPPSLSPPFSRPAVQASAPRRPKYVAFDWASSPSPSSSSSSSIQDSVVSSIGPPDEYEPDPVAATYVGQIKAQVGGAYISEISANTEEVWVRDMFAAGYSWRLPEYRGGEQESILQLFQNPSIRGRVGEDEIVGGISQVQRKPRRGCLCPLSKERVTSDLNSFGNFLCAPPQPRWPLGRIVFGTARDRPPNLAIVSFLEAQLLQSPFSIDTSWLQVGHADEVLRFIPYPHSRYGFKVVMPSPRLALDILRGNPGLKLFRGLDRKLLGGSKSRSAEGSPANAEFSCQAVLQSPWGAAGNLEDQNVKVQKLLEAIKTQVLEALSLAPDDVIELPVLFHRMGYTETDVVLSSLSREATRKAFVAYTPNVVNMLVFTTSIDSPVLCIPKPYGPAAEAGPCLFEQWITKLLEPSGNQIRFIDDFQTCHVNTGEIHCSTLELRTPANKVHWWEGLQ